MIALDATDKVILIEDKASCLCCIGEGGSGGDLGTLLLAATSQGGGLGCAMGPLDVFFSEASPYALAAGTYLLTVDFTTGDELYHQGAWYQIDVGFAGVGAINWAKVWGGNVAPWTVMNNGWTIRYDIEDSIDCGGANANIQTGRAQALIVLEDPDAISFMVDGLAELQAAGFENISLYIKEII